MGSWLGSQVTVKINFIAQDPNDQDMIGRHHVNDGEPGVVMDADRWGEFRSVRGQQWLLGNKGYRLAETLLESISLIGTEALQPIKVAVNKVCLGADREPNVHAHQPAPAPLP